MTRAKSWHSARTDTGNQHPLFAKDYVTYYRDQLWRVDIPKAGVSDNIDWQTKVATRQGKTRPVKPPNIRSE